MHPFTCPSDDHEGILVANAAGWHCPECDYFQSWAHDFMADWSWRGRSDTERAALLKYAAQMSSAAEVVLEQGLLNMALADAPHLSAGLKNELLNRAEDINTRFLASRWSRV